MDIQSLTAPTSADTTASDAAIQSTSALGNEDTFLQLLIAQIQNQDPTNPVDSTAFVTQLAQFSSLEQLIGIRQGVTALGTAAGATTTTPDPTTTNPTTTPTNSTTQTQN